MSTKDCRADVEDSTLTATGKVAIIGATTPSSEESSKRSDRVSPKTTLSVRMYAPRIVAQAS